MEKEYAVWRIAQYSDKGTRLTNEDRILAEEMEGRTCITLADGVGRHGGGSTAATAVTGKMTEIFRDLEAKDLKKENLEKSMRRAMEETNQTVLRLQTLRCRLQATCVVLWIVCAAEGEIQAVWGHVGDSRLYFFEKGKLVFKTRDHSMKNLLGEGPEAENLSRDVIWQAMGERDGIKPEISHPTAVREDAVFLLCSDGLWECISDQALEESLGSAESPEEWLECLQEMVQKHGREEYDNNSAAAIFINRRM